MSTLRAYHPELAVGRLILSREESHHAAVVRRCRPGEALVLLDGRGGQADAEVIEVRRSRVTVEVHGLVRNEFDQPTRLTLAVAMPRQHRQPFLVEKCTELGVWAIWPLLTERSVVKPGKHQVERWQRTAIEAAKQAGRSWMPQIEAARPLASTLECIDEFDAAVATDPRRAFDLLPDVLAVKSSARSLIVWIGPEGGLTDAEVDALIAAGAAGARLGPNVLRVETAALTVAALVAVVRPTDRVGNQDMAPCPRKPE